MCTAVARGPRCWSHACHAGKGCMRRRPPLASSAAPRWRYTRKQGSTDARPADGQLCDGAVAHGTGLELYDLPLHSCQQHKSTESLPHSENDSPTFMEGPVRHSAAHVAHIAQGDGPWRRGHLVADQITQQLLRTKGRRERGRPISHPSQALSVHSWQPRWGHRGVEHAC